MQNAAAAQVKFSLDLLGPLVNLIGIWEGDRGSDTAPADPDRTKTAISKYREVMSFVPFGPVNNHEQVLYGLKYNTMAWRHGSPDAFHDDQGFWLWDGNAGQIMKCFIVPRGITVLAGGQCASNAKSFSVSAKLGDAVFGICSNPFLDREFKTMRYDLKIDVTGDHFTYESNTVLQIKGQSAAFNHLDTNTLFKQP